ncbi:hypothetical protein OIU84_000032 [Salix udensis]|uniref:Uncharacterized protein n=1 Tax=Salix udensis TaxID=889485 RepID=A0AAD6PNE8_9ROSI|nr:hypothetical protein OIU84_000032 [Salix udensis]
MEGVASCWFIAGGGIGRITGCDVAPPRFKFSPDTVKHPPPPPAPPPTE